jgi:hypothetical protein
MALMDEYTHHVYGFFLELTAARFALNYYLLWQVVYQVFYALPEKGRRRNSMSRIKGFSRLNYDILRSAVVAGLVLFAITYMCDAILYSLGIAAAKTILNDVAIALAGAVLLVIFLSRSRKNQIVEQAKARAMVVEAVSHYVRDVFTPLALVMSSQDTAERLRILDMATDRVDYVLSQVLPTVGTADKSRQVYFPTRTHFDS